MPTVLITDCTSSIGLDSATLFSAIGWNVIATKRSRDLQIELDENDRTWITRLDVCDLDEITATIDEGVTRFGNIDVLVINAMHHQIGLLEAVPRKNLIQHFAINMLGTIDMIRSIMPHFRQKQTGVVIVVVSSPDRSILPLMSSVYATNFALEGFLEAFRPEAASQGVIVKLVIRYCSPSEMIFQEHALSYLSDFSLEDYHDYIKVSENVLTKKRGGSRSSEEVARVIYNAASDGNSSLRYLVGNEKGIHNGHEGDILDTSYGLRLHTN